MFKSNQQQDFEAEIPIQIRCGPTLMLKVHANVITPEVSIVENDFKFGEVLYGDSHSLPFTLENNSPIEAILELDLRDYGEFQLVPRLADGVDTEIMVPIVEQADYKVNLDDPENVSDVNEGDLDEDDDELEQDRMNYVTIRLKPSSQLIFDLVYKPDQVEEEANF